MTKMFLPHAASPVTVAASGLSDTETPGAAVVTDGAFHVGGLTGREFRGVTVCTTAASLDRRNAQQSIEPYQLRTRFEVQAVSGADRAVFDLLTGTVWDEIGFGYALRDGALDGMPCDVYRFDDVAETMSLVRSTTVATQRARGWKEAQGMTRDKVMTQRTFNFTTYGGYLQDHPTWIGVFAVDASGHVSPVAYSAATTQPSTSPTITAASGNVDKVVDFDTPSATLTAPQNLNVDAATDPDHLVVTWDPPSVTTGLAGYVVVYAEEDPATFAGNRECYIDLTPGGAALAVGDYLVVRGVLDDPAAGPHPIISDRWAAAAAARFIAPVPEILIRRTKTMYDASAIVAPGDPGISWEWRTWGVGERPGHDVGAHYLRLTVGAGETAYFDVWQYGPEGDDFNPVIKPGESYRHRAYMRDANGVGFNATFSIRGPSPLWTNGLGSDQVVAVGGNWGWCETTHTPDGTAYLSGGVYHSAVEVVGPATLDLAGLWLGKAGDEPFTVPAAVVSEMEAATHARYHHTVKLRERQGRLEEYLAGDFLNGGSLAHWIKQTPAGVQPWIQISAHLTEDECLGLVDWLAAPNGASKWTDLRELAGIAGPLTDSYDDMIFEMGNEVWLYSIDQPFDFIGGDGGERAGAWFQMLIDFMKGSPYWAALRPKLRFALSSQQNATTWPAGALEACPDLDDMNLAPYLGGWEGGGAIPLNDAAGHAQLQGLELAEAMAAQATLQSVVEAGVAARLLAGNPRPIRMGWYEGGPGFDLPPGGGSDPSRIDFDPLSDETSTEQVMKSQNAAVAQAALILDGARRGFGSPNWFVAKSGTRWSSRTDDALGAVDSPAWEVMRELGALFTGTLCDVIATSPIAISLGETDVASAVDVGASRDGSRYSVLILNRDLSATRSLALHLPFATAQSLTYRRMIGSYDDTPWIASGGAPLMESGSLAVPEDCRVLEVNAALGAAAGGMPAGSWLLLTFAGVSG